MNRPSRCDRSNVKWTSDRDDLLKRVDFKVNCTSHWSIPTDSHECSMRIENWNGWIDRSKRDERKNLTRIKLGAREPSPLPREIPHSKHVFREIFIWNLHMRVIHAHIFNTLFLDSWYTCSITHSHSHTQHTLFSKTCQTLAFVIELLYFIGLLFRCCKTRWSCYNKTTRAWKL